MATLKERLHRKNAQGTYDVVHLETASSLVLRPGGRTVEQDLTDYLPEIQATESLPKTLIREKSEGGIKSRWQRLNSDFIARTHLAHTMWSIWKPAPTWC